MTPRPLTLRLLPGSGRTLVVSGPELDGLQVLIRIPTNAPRLLRATFHRGERVLVLEGRADPAFRWRELHRQTIAAPAPDQPATVIVTDA